MCPVLYSRQSAQRAAHIDEVAALPANVREAHVVDLEAHRACHAHQQPLMGQTGEHGGAAGQDAGPDGGL